MNKLEQAFLQGFHKRADDYSKPVDEVDSNMLGTILRPGLINAGLGGLTGAMAGRIMKDPGLAALLGTTGAGIGGLLGLHSGVNAYDKDLERAKLQAIYNHLNPNKHKNHD